MDDCTSGCTPGLDVALRAIEGSDRYPEYTDDFTEAIMAWALSHPR